jgi:hypothetical protein
MQVEGNGFPTSPEALFHELVNQLGLYSRS